ncbi:hypothetical protein Q1695_013177 [Nippostrongylus brasiliensis]|nr:hypothetical protein Q1695_013177 [Nippostrongylus brasiliensis]
MPQLRIAVGYRTSASAVLIARDVVREQGLLPGYTFEFITMFDECDEERATGLVIDMINERKVDVVIGPTCSDAAIISAIIAAYYNVPLLTWGLSTSSALDNPLRFPTTVVLSVNSYSLGVAIRSVLLTFDWDQFAMVYSTVGDSEESCLTVKSDIQDAVNHLHDVTINYSGRLFSMSKEAVQFTMEIVKDRARIVILCIPDVHKRTFMLHLLDAGYLNSEFVFIFVDPTSKIFVISERGGGEHYVWMDENVPNDGRDEDAKEAFSWVMSITDRLKGEPDVQGNQTFSKEVVRRMRDPPFNCIEECDKPEYQTASQYAPQLYDTFYTYAVALNRTLPSNRTLRNGREILRHIAMKFQGVSSEIMIGPNGTRYPTFYFNGIAENYKVRTYGKIFVHGSIGTYAPLYADQSRLWWKHGHRPPAVPKCGFKGLQCPLNIFETYRAWFIVAIAIFIFAIIFCIIAIIKYRREKVKEEKRLNTLWQISFARLKEPNAKNKCLNSLRSLESTPSTTNSSYKIDRLCDTRRFTFYEYEGDIVAARKHELRIRIEQHEGLHWRTIRQFEHENLNRFIGLCLDGPLMLSLWKYCTRGSINDVIERNSIKIDGFFVFALLKDIVQGLEFLHRSPLQCHGFLTAENCLIDDRWQVKISEYGLDLQRFGDKPTQTELLWTAPEHLRLGDFEGSQKGDVYSFAIIAAQLITKTRAWDLNNRKEEPDEIIYMLKKGGYNAPRPNLEPHETVEANPALLHLVRDCWTEHPSERPTIAQVRDQLRSMQTDKNANLMDYVFNMLESYASSLEQEVDERTKELVMEKRKSDILLYRMLPRQVAEKLKLGQTVEPESYESVTLFFSDVVSFTTIAAKGSPLQVVNLLNSLYTIFDSIIDEHDVYKVETIGDAYLCVSGLPKRNGNEHIKEICSMSLGFMKALTDFRIPYLPQERLNIRVGLHSGSVVAGVVGLTMPRYCLFGDAVNTASRMESNGKPGMVHLSSEANRLLEIVGGFKTERRGEVIIKGKGVMETFWLNEIDDNFSSLKKDDRNAAEASVS